MMAPRSRYLCSFGQLHYIEHKLAGPRLIVLANQEGGLEYQIDDETLSLLLEAFGTPECIEKEIARYDSRRMS